MRVLLNLWNNKLSSRKHMHEQKEDKSFSIQNLYINELINSLNAPNMDNEKLDEIAKKFTGQIISVDEERRREKNREFNRSLLPDQGQELARNEKVILKAISESEHDSYIQVSYECALLKGFYKNKDFVQDVWSDFISDKAANYSIYDLQDGNYIGYCGIKDIYAGVWEIVIEIMQQYQHKGYGYSALSLMLKSLSKMTRVTEYKSYVEVDNYTSQALMRKIGGTPDGIREMFFHGNDLILLQDEYEPKIDDDLKTVAHEFDVEPKKLIGCVLKYAIHI